MNDPVSLVTLILIGICATSAIFHAFIAFRKPFSRVHMYFLFTVCGISLFELFHLFTLYAPNIDNYVFNLRLEIDAIITFAIFLNWFIREYTNKASNRFEIAASIFLAIGYVFNHAKPYTLQYSSIESLRTVDALGSKGLVLANGQISDIFCTVAIVMFISFVHIILLLYRHYQKTKSVTTLIMGASTLLLIITGFQGVMVRVEAIDSIHLGPFGIMAMVITMSIALMRELIIAIHESEIRYRSLVEQSPFSIQLLNPNGLTIRVNKAWENLWGSERKNATTQNVFSQQDYIENGIIPYLEKGFSGIATEIPATKFSLPPSHDIQGNVTEKWVRAYIYPIKDESDRVQEIVLQHEDISEKKRLEDAFRIAASAFSADFGASLFEQMAASITQLLDIEYALIAKLDYKNEMRLKSLAFCNKQSILQNVELSIENSPIADIFNSGKLLLKYPPGQVIPHSFFCCFKIQNILASALTDASLKPLGILLLFDSRQFSHMNSLHAVIDIFSVRASAELERNNAYELMQEQQAQLQKIVDQRTRELTLANKELEAFSYSVSHDLRAPLRSISGFASILNEDFKKQIPKDAIGYMDRIQENANYMSNLIDDLLQLSRVSRFHISRTRVDLSKLIEASIQKQQEEDPRRDAEIQIEPDIIVQGDRNLLEIAVDNLISNAWKYTAKTACTMIEFGQKISDGHPVYYIRDNGAGFDMKYSHKLFTAFNRLHSSDDFQGTGVGLATVSRIISRHNGKIWADAKPDGGASFYFTLQNVVSSLTAAV